MLIVMRFKITTKKPKTFFTLHNIYDFILLYGENKNREYKVELIIK